MSTLNHTANMHWRSISTIAILLFLLTPGLGNACETDTKNCRVKDYLKVLKKQRCSGCNLSGADFSGKDLSGVNLSKSNLRGAILTGANLTDANLSNANLSCSTTNGESRCTDFSNVNATNLQAKNANFSGANMKNSNFLDAEMRSTNLEDAKLDNSLFCKAKLKKAKMPNKTVFNAKNGLTLFHASNNCTAPLARVTAIDFCSAPHSMFNNPTAVPLGITPTVWSNSDDLSIDLSPPIPYQQIMSEIALSGFSGTQMSPKFPADPDSTPPYKHLKAELDLRGITISEPWVGTYFTLNKPAANEETQKIFDSQVTLMQTMNGDIIVMAELGGAVHQQPLPPLSTRPILTEAQIIKLAEELDILGAQAEKEGMKLAYHFHIGTAIQSANDIEILMDNSDKVRLLLDTGHALWAGIDPLELTQKYADRISHVHLKNIRQGKIEEAQEKGWSFLEAVRNGIFTVPGDPEGVIDFEPILQTLADSDYQGWLIVEAEQDPNQYNPLEYAKIARQYLCDTAGL